MAEPLAAQRLGFRIVFALLIFGASQVHAQQSRLSQIELPDGFSIGVFADDVRGARSLAQSPAGTVFVGTRPEGAVYAVVDPDGYSIRARDAATGEVAEYRNEPGRPAPAITDNRAFSQACAASASVP